MEDKILSLYACGMSQKDIAEQIKSLYDVEISPELVSKISEKIMPEVNAWQNRPLESSYPFIFMDAIHYKVKEDHRYVTKAAYVVLGITMDGRKDILGVWIGEHESSKFWLNVLNDLKSRGVQDVYLFCTDGLCGMMQAIQAVYPKSRLQRCIVHQIRSSTKYVRKCLPFAQCCFFLQRCARPCTHSFQIMSTRNTLPRFIPPIWRLWNKWTMQLCSGRRNLPMPTTLSNPNPCRC